MDHEPQPVERLALLEEDPGFALGIPEDQRAHAAAVLTVPSITQASGSLVLHGAGDGPTLGVLVLSGFLTVSTAIVDRVVEQIVGPGDILHPSTQPTGSVPLQLSYEVIRPARLAVLDRRFLAASRRWPGLLLVLHERVCAQERQLYMHAAAAKQRRSEDRVLATLWQIADRWGRVTAKGVTLPVHPSHAALGRLSGASRPTVTLALKALQQDGHLFKDDDGRLVLAPDSWQTLDPKGAARPRGTKAARPKPGRPAVDVSGLLARVAAMHEDFDGRARRVERSLAEAKSTIEANAEIRRRARDQRSLD